jgi:hypothetical protein
MNRNQEHLAATKAAVEVNTFSDFYDPRDSIAAMYIDTGSLKGKRQYILREFQLNHVSGPMYDSLFDVNYDGTPDYIIGYYGESGTGIKNRIEVYAQDAKTERYIYDEQLSGVPNPTFYLKKKKITGFYIPMGSGHGEQLEWLGHKWIVTMEFDVDNLEENSVWEISYPLTGRKKEVRMAYQMIPPQEIMETNIDY